jgi:alkanesulfonate monooxygenase SsuD/methylene tetrahydromethanopterin reductase-like flavin-dependent oxidoreductase (luciferase family)
MDEPVDGSASQAIQSNVDAMARTLGAGWTKRALIDRLALGSRQPPIVGDAEQVVEALAAWVADTDVDGFNLSRTVVPECLEDFIALVVPRLQERGMYKRAYREGTYREKLFGPTG